jgi:hypothetical protein
MSGLQTMRHRKVFVRCLLMRFWEQLFCRLDDRLFAMLPFPVRYDHETIGKTAFRPINL